MSFGSIGPVDQALLPDSIRNGTPEQKQAYTSALGFEQMLVDQLSQALAVVGLPGRFVLGLRRRLRFGFQLGLGLVALRERPRLEHVRPTAPDGADLKRHVSRWTRNRSAARVGDCPGRLLRSIDTVQAMSTALSLPDQDGVLTSDVLAHLEVQLLSARRLLQIILKQGEAIRERNVQSVVALTGILQAEMQRRTLLEDERSRLLDRAGARLGISPGTVTLTLLAGLMPEPAAQDALERSWELRGLLDELQREHTVNRALMHQELAFLDHLLRLADGRIDSGYDAVGERPTTTMSLGANRRMFDLQA